MMSVDAAAMRSGRGIGTAVTRLCCGRYPMPQLRRLTFERRFAKNDNNISSLDDF
jgi:hypothetical protein